MKPYFLLLVSVLSIAQAISQNKASIASAEISFVYLSSNVDGTLKGFTSSSTIDLEDITRSKFEGTVATETIKTSNFLRDWSLRGGKHFDVDNFPNITFKGSKVTATLSGFSVLGNLTIRDNTKPITLKFIKEGKKLIGTTSLNTFDFGIPIKKNREDNKVDVKMVFVLK